MRKSALGMGLVVAGVTVATIFALEMVYGGDETEAEAKALSAESVFSSSPPAKLDPSAQTNLSTDAKADVGSKTLEDEIRMIARVEAQSAATDAATEAARNTLDSELY